MNGNTKIEPGKWDKLPEGFLQNEEMVRPNITYWQHAWRRLKKNHLSIISLITITLLILLALLGPKLSSFTYSEQNLDRANLPPILDYYELDSDTYFYINKEYKLYRITKEGHILDKITAVGNDLVNRNKRYDIDGKHVVVDYSFSSKPEIKQKSSYEVIVDNNIILPKGKVYNKTYIFGSDSLGRDIFVRVLYGARISLFIAFVATVVQFIIGVTYGGIAGYFGGAIDNIMMRIVDVIQTIPQILIVILLMVVIGAGLKTIIIAIGSVYWVSMARIVRGSILSIKEQEYVLAAKTIGASHSRIIVKHLIPNIMGPIIIALAMNIPNAIFNEAFLSFIGLGVSAPMASWGTLANDALNGLRNFGYQLFFPSLFICITILSFNFLGDGLRDALDPRLLK